MPTAKKGDSTPKPDGATTPPDEQPQDVESAPVAPSKDVPKASEMETWQAGVAANEAAQAEAAKIVAAKVAAPAKPPKKRSRPAWRETRWGTHPNYECKSCHYSTLDLKAMAAHADANHPEEDK